MEKDEPASPDKEQKKLLRSPRLKVLQSHSGEHAGNDAIDSSLGAAAAALPEEEDPSSDSWGNWFSKSMESAKVKSNEMYQYLKQDISEFGESIQEASRDLKDKLKLEDTAKAAAETVGEKVTTLLGHVTSIFGVEPDDEDETTILLGKDGPVVISRIEARIHSLAINENIFLQDPEDLEGYDAWMATFDLETKSCEMTEWLTNNPHLQLHYQQLVPEKVTHLVFWHRFYYQVQLIALEEERMVIKEAIDAKRKRAKREVERDSDTGSGSGNDIVHISEEDQKRILAEYELEMKNIGPLVGPSESSSAQHSRRSSEQLSSSSSSFAFVTRDAVTNEVKLE